MSFVFFGTPHFSEIVLEILISKGYKPDLVITAPDKPVGRKQILTPTSVKQLALKNNIHVATPINNAELINIIVGAGLAPAQGRPQGSPLQFGILAAYGLILPSSVINSLPKGILNIHPSLLPKYRGATPIQTAILNGETETGVTIIKLNEKVDTGAIVAQEKMKILPTDTTETLGEKLFTAGAKLLIKNLTDYLEEKIKLTPQNNIVGADHGQPKGTPWYAPTNITKKFTKQDGFILFEEVQTALRDNAELSAKIDRKFRAFFPWPGIWTKDSKNKRILITKCHLKNEVLKIDLIKKDGSSDSTPDTSLLK